MTNLLAWRPMQEQDLPTLMPIEELAYPFPWTVGNFKDCLKNNYHCLVYEQENEIAAYTVLMVVLDELHILNFCVNPRLQGKGIGHQWLDTIEQFAKQHQIETCFLEVRPSNIAAIKLYLSHGFNEIGLRKGYYPAKIGREDAIVMAKTLLAFGIQ